MQGIAVGAPAAKANAAVVAARLTELQGWRLCARLDLWKNAHGALSSLLNRAYFACALYSTLNYYLFGELLTDPCFPS